MSGARPVADVEDADLLRAHEPLVGAGGERVATDVMDVEGQRSPALGAIDVAIDASFAGHRGQLLRRQLEAADVGNLGERENLRAVRAGLGEQLHHLLVALRHPGHRNPDDLQAEALGPNIPGLVVGDVVLIPDDDLVALLGS